MSEWIAVTLQLASIGLFLAALHFSRRVGLHRTATKLYEASGDLWLRVKLHRAAGEDQAAAALTAAARTASATADRFVAEHRLRG